MLSHWQTQEDAARLAGALGQAMARTHLLGGHDVIIAAFSIRPSFFADVDALVRDVSPDFHEVRLVADERAIVDRFCRRRDQRNRTGTPDVSADISTESLPEVLRRACAELDRLATERPHVTRLDADGDLDGTYDGLLALLETGPSDGQ